MQNVSVYMEAMSWEVVCTALVKRAQERLMQSGRGAQEDYEVCFGARSSCLTGRQKNFCLVLLSKMDPQKAFIATNVWARGEKIPKMKRKMI